MAIHREHLLGFAKSASGRIKTAFGRATKRETLINAGRHDLAEGRIRIGIGDDSIGRRR